MPEKLTQINPENFTDPKVREILVLLLNVIEDYEKQIKEQKQIIQELGDEISRLKGEQGKPKIAEKTKQNYSSKEYIKTSKEHKKESKKEKMTFDNTVNCPLDKTNLPSDLIYKGKESIISQDIIFKRNNTEYIIEIWYSPSEKKSYRSKPPKEYSGYFGSSLRAYCLVMHHLLDVTRNKLIGFVNSMGITMSDGSLQNILTEKSEMWCKEKNDLLKAGLESPFLQTDSTGARVSGENHKTHVFVSELFTVFTTKPSNSRLDILSALQAEESLRLEYNETTVKYFEHYKISENWRKIVSDIFEKSRIIEKKEFVEIIKNQYPELTKKPTIFKWIVESLAFGHYFKQKEYKAPKILVSDDAKEYQLLSESHALCWVHDARFYNKLTPLIDCHREIVEDFKQRYWSFYDKLKEYRKNPNKEFKEYLIVQFDALFIPNTSYFVLNKEISRSLANKKQLLMVLDYPFIPLHNNAAELAVRSQVRKRDISLHTMTALGTKLQDAFLSIIHTCYKLNTNVYLYIFDRLNNIADFYLPDFLLSQIIANKNHSLNSF